MCRQTAEETIAAMCSTMELRTVRSPRTIRFYREELATVVKVLRSGGRHTLPWEIDEEDVRWLLGHYIEEGLTVSTRRGYISALKTWTEWYGNHAIIAMRIRWPTDMRPTVDWLTEDEARRLLELRMTPAQALVVHCELCLGMRRIEVLRLRTDSLHPEERCIEILGKGPQGGKPRLMPYHRDTETVVGRYLEMRGHLVALSETADPSWPTPDTLLVWSRGGRVMEYAPKGSGIDAMLQPLGAQLGRRIGNHTLRRTFGRMMYQSGVEVATISRMMGHESTEQTLKYIGVNLDMMSDAMRQFKLRGGVTDECYGC